jgi:phosphate-selective porin OprO/OprP
VEADLANSDVQLTDVYLTYAPSKALTITLGQHKPFWGLDELTSDLNTSMMERAAYTNAFGFERRVGLSATYVHGALLAEGGVFTDDAIALNNDLDKSWSVDGRLVAMPKLAGGTLHLGGSVHWRDLNGSAANFRYRVRPFLHTTDLRFVDTGTLPATGERGLGAEAAWIGGRFHVVGESFWQTVRRPGFADPTFNGGYAEVGYLLTRDQTAYRNGVFEQIRPRAPLGSGGLGAVQVNVRYDWLSLSDAGIRGGRQHSAGIAVIWMPTMLVRFIATYGHLWTKDASVAAGFDRDYGADAAGMRAQFNF